MNGDRRARWAISFADLALLLLGFFVLLQASGSRSKDVLQGVSEQFGGQKPVSTANSVEWSASSLFAPGEAMLTPAGRAKILGFSQGHAGERSRVELTSIGQDRAAHRFDAWDLAAARLGAVARALEGAGIGEKQLIVRGLDEASAPGGGQIIRVTRSPLPATAKTD